MVDLSTNINFIKPQININMQNIDISSSANSSSLYTSLAKRYKVKKEQIELFSHESSAIYSLFRFLDLKYCTIYSPIDLIYKKACVNFAYEIRTINRFENMNLPVKDGSLIVFANPSNVDGTLYDMQTLLTYWMEKSCTILIDESFLDFTEAKSVSEYINNYDKLYILKSTSYYFGYEGLKCTTLISNEKNINSLKRFEPEYKLSTFDIKYLDELLKDKNFKSISKAVNTKSKIELEKILQSSDLIENIYHSSTNFILVKLKEIQSWDFQKLLEPYNIKIKDCSDYDYLDSSYIRISLCSQHEIQNFKKALSSAY